MTARAPSNRLLFMNRGEFTYYIDGLAAQVEACGWEGLHLVLMTNHLHFLVRTPRENLAIGMKALHEDFGTFINKSRGETGHVFGGRFKNKLVLTDSHYAATMRYIAMNPVKAGMCERPEDYPWSAHRTLSDPAAPRRGLIDVDTALGLLGTDAAGYAELVGRSDRQIMVELQAAHEGDLWLIPARDEHRIPMDEIAKHMGLHPATVYRRLAKARIEGQTPDSRESGV